MQGCDAPGENAAVCSNARKLPPLVRTRCPRAGFSMPLTLRYRGRRGEGGEGSASPELKQYAEIQDASRNEFKEKFEVAQKANEENWMRYAAKDDASKSDSKDIDDAKELDALIAKRNARKNLPLIVAAQNALNDSDYDSDEEDVDEGNEAELRSKYKFEMMCKEGEGGGCCRNNRRQGGGSARGGLKTRPS